MQFPTPNITSFIMNFDKFLREPNHFAIVSLTIAASNDVNYHVDPTSFLVMFLKIVFAKSRSLIQFSDNESFLYRMCIAYQNFTQLTEIEFNSLNRTILNDAMSCRTDEELLRMLTSAVVTTEATKIQAWNDQIRYMFVFQLCQSPDSTKFDVANQITLVNLRMSVDTPKSRTISIYDRKNRVVFMLENIRFRKEVRTDKTRVIMVEFEAEWSAPGGCRNQRCRSLFRIRGKSRARPVNEEPKDIHFALVDLFANYLDNSRA
jgi:hypothetical protein